jgi:hypothetical protein
MSLGNDLTRLANLNLGLVHPVAPVFNETKVTDL